jgi:hypothetical protein
MPHFHSPHGEPVTLLSLWERLQARCSFVVSKEQRLSLAFGERVTSLCVATAPQERREQRSWPAGRRAGARSQESNQEKGHPTLAPYAQSLCSRYARPLRGSLTVHPWTGIELAHVVWAILRTIPAQPRRDRGDPDIALPARQSQSPLGNCSCVALPPASMQSSSPLPGTFSRPAGEGRPELKANAKLKVCGKLLCLGCAGCAVNGPPMQRRTGGEKARRVARRDASQLAASPWMDCQPTPEPMPGDRCIGVAFSLPTLLLATQEKVGRSPQASESPALILQNSRREAMHSKSMSEELDPGLRRDDNGDQERKLRPPRAACQS